MTAASRASGVVALAFLAGIGTAGAQQDGTGDGPIQLFPAQPPSTETEPQRDGASGSAAPDGPGEPEPLQGKEGITVESLESVDAEAIGLLTAAEGGLPTSMWQGTPRAAVVPLVAGIPVGEPPFPGARDLARRLLLSAAGIPEGASPGGSPLGARAERLIALGFPHDARNLIRSNRAEVQDSLVWVKVQADLATGALPDACAEAEGRAETASDLFWQKLLSFCQALAGQTSSAQLGTQLLREMGESDTLYFELMDAITAGISPQLTDLTGAGPLHAAMMAEAGAVPPASAADTAGAPIARQIALKSDQIAAAETVAKRGFISPVELRARYASVEFKESVLADPLGTVDQVSGPLARALLYRATRGQDVPAAQAELIAEALKRAWQDGLYPQAAAAFAAELDRVSPQAALSWFAPEAARAYYLLGQTDKARVWHKLLAGTNDENAAAQAYRLWPFAQLSGSDYAVGPAARKRWEDDLKAAEKDADVRIANTLAIVVAAGGLDTGGGLRSAALSEDMAAGHGTPASPALRSALAEAAHDGRMAETVILALRLLASVPPDAADPGNYAEAVRRLKRIGLGADARRIAMEALAVAMR